MRILTILAVLLMMSVPPASWAQPRGPGSYRGAPYGQFCPGMRWGPYGAPRPVRTGEEAKHVMETYFSTCPRMRQPVHVGRIEEKKWYFEVEILGPEGALIDKAIVDKRTGRIRSIY